jgi:hypothetical protein
MYARTIILYYYINIKKNLIIKETSNVKMLNGSVMHKLANNGSLDIV